MLTASILIGLCALLLSGVPIFAALGLASLVIMYLTEGNINAAGMVVFEKLNNPQLTVIPMFALMAHAMAKAKVIDDLYDAAQAFVGHLRGGLGVATVLASALFAAISGSSVVTALTIGSAAIPQMKRYGYPAWQSYGVVAAGGTLGILIPPSGPMILYAIVTEASIGALFLAGIIPGLLLAALFAVWCMISAGAKYNITRTAWVGGKGLASAIGNSIWAILMPIVVLGGIYAGIVTAQEAAAIGCVYAIGVGSIIYRNFGIKALWETLAGAVQTSAMLFMIIASASIFAYAITIIRLPNHLIEMVTAMELSKVGFILVVMAVVFILGMFLESIAIILITTPIVLPVLQALGINLVWYGVILMVNLEVAMITPPVGMNLFTIKGITNAPMAHIIRGASPYVALMILGLVVLLLVPELATWLPNVAGYAN
ncbi:MAG: TRAP transporter large permease [Desulfopila sp.]